MDDGLFRTKTQLQDPQNLRNLPESRRSDKNINQDSIPKYGEENNDSNVEEMENKGKIGVSCN